MADNKGRNNWFSRSIDKDGPDFLDSGKVTVEKIGNNADRIIDDIIFGAIDYSIYGSYVIHPLIISQLIQFCSDKIAVLSAEQYALHHVHNEYAGGNLYIISDFGGPIASDNQRQVQDDNHMVYGSVLRNIEMLIPRIDYNLYKYCTVKQFLECVEVTGDPFRLYDLANMFSSLEKTNKKNFI